MQKRARVSRKSRIGTSRPLGLQLLGTGSSSTHTFHKPNRREKKMTKKDIPSYKFWNWNLLVKTFLEACLPKGKRGHNRQVKSFDQRIRKGRTGATRINFAKGCAKAQDRWPPTPHSTSWLKGQET